MKSAEYSYAYWMTPISYIQTQKHVCVWTQKHIYRTTLQREKEGKGEKYVNIFEIGQ